MQYKFTQNDINLVKLILINIILHQNKWSVRHLINIKNMMK